MLPQISFVIPVLNGASTLRTCLNSIFELSYPQELLEVIVVNNDSTDETATIANSYPQVKFVFEDKIGRSNARNSGWRVASHELIAFIDCDVKLEKQWVRFIIKQFRSSKIGCAQGKIQIASMNAKETIFDKFRKHKRNAQTNFTMIDTTVFSDSFPLINTASCVYRRKVLIELGGFDPSFIRNEDSDLSLRASRAGYVNAFSDMALSQVFWDKGSYIALAKKLILDSKYGILLKRKYSKKSSSPFSTFIDGSKWSINSFVHPGGGLLLLLDFAYRFISTLSYTYYDLITNKDLSHQSNNESSILKMIFNSGVRHLEIKRYVGKHLGLEDLSSILSIKTCPHIRISISPSEIYLFDTIYRKTFIFREEQFYFLRSFILDDDYYFNRSGTERFRTMLTTVLTPLIDSLFLETEIDKEKICLNPFISFKKYVNEDMETEAYNCSMARSYAPMNSIFSKNQRHQKNIFDFLDTHLAKEHWHKGITEGQGDLTINQLCKNGILSSLTSFDRELKNAFSLDFYLKDDSKWKKNKIINIPEGLKLEVNLRDQLIGKKDKLDLFLSPIKQMNNLMTLSVHVFWSYPWSFNYPLPIYIEEEIKHKLLNFNRDDWTNPELRDLIDAGVLVSSKLEELSIDVDKLAKDFINTSAFFVTDSVASFLTWSMGKFLYSYFNSGLFKIGDYQCADRKAVYDNPLCLHIQDGFSKLVNRILPFKVKSSFNYSVNYLEYAELYPHKDRIEAPYSMSFTLAAFEQKSRSNYKNTLGFFDKNGLQTEIPLADGDIVLFNGYSLNHYRHPIPQGHSLYVIVMHFVEESFSGNIG